MEALFKAVAVDCVLRLDPELEAQGDTPPPPKGNRSLASEISGMSMSLKALSLLLFSQESKEFLSLGFPSSSLEASKRCTVLAEKPSFHRIIRSGQQGPKGTS